MDNPAPTTPTAGAERRQWQCGVSVTWLKEFATLSVSKEMTTQQVADILIIPPTKEKQCRYVDMLDSRYVGPATYFISHRWQANFHELVELVGNYCGILHPSRLEQAPAETFLWIDLFAVNQHCPAADLGEIKDVIARSMQTLLCIDRAQQVLTRVWCVYEAWQTLERPVKLRPPSRNGGFSTPLKSLQVLFPPDANVSEAIADMWRTLDIGRAQASKQEDAVAIFNDIKKVAPLSMINQQVRSALLEPEVGMWMGTPNMRQSVLEWGGVVSNRPEGTSWLYPRSHPQLEELGHKFSAEAAEAMREWQQRHRSMACPEAGQLSSVSIMLLLVLAIAAACIATSGVVGICISRWCNP